MNVPETEETVGQQVKQLGRDVQKIGIHLEAHGATWEKTGGREGLESAFDECVELEGLLVKLEQLLEAEAVRS